MSRRDRASSSPGPSDETPTPGAAQGAGNGTGDHGDAGGRFRDLLTYGASRGVSHGLLAARGLVVATLLGPAGFGAWTLFRMALEYAAAADLGALHGLELAVAQDDARARDGTAEGGGAREARTALGFNLAVYASLAIGALVASFVVSDQGWTMGLRGFAAAVVAERLWRYAIVYLRARARVRRYSVLEVVSGGLHLGLTVLGAWIWGLAGALGAYAGASLLSAAVSAPDVPARPRLRRDTLRPLLRVGLPLLAALSVSTVLSTADRLVVAAYGGTTMLGHYAFAVAVAGIAASAVWAVRTVVFPDVYGKAETRGAGVAVQDHMTRTLLPFAALFPPILGVAAFGIGPVVAAFLPEYGEAIAPARLFLFTGVTYGFVTLGSLSVVAADRQRLLPVLGAGAVVLNVGLSLAALELGAGLEGVAAAALVGQSAFGAGILIVSAVEAGEDRPVRLVARALVPLAYCALSVFVLGTLFPARDAGAAATAGGLFLLTLLPLAPILWRSVRALRRQVAAEAA